MKVVEQVERRPHAGFWLGVNHRLRVLAHEFIHQPNTPPLRQALLASANAILEAFDRDWERRGHAREARGALGANVRHRSNP